MRGGAPRSRSHSVFHLTPATAVGVQTIDDRSCCCSARRCFPISAAPLMVAHASSWTPESLSRTLPRRARGAPARLKPRGLLRIQDQPLDPSVTDDMHGRPVHVPAAQARRVRRAIAREDPLLAGPVCEVADVVLDLTRFGGHCRSHESAVGVFHGQTKTAGVYGG